MDDTAGRQGLVHIYTGNGKGKTTAAIGLLVRARGAGMRCLFCQFLKGWDTAELEPLRQLGVELLRTSEVKKFVPFMTDTEKNECVKSHEMCYNKMAELLCSEKYEMVVLDEAIAAAALGLIHTAELYRLIRERPPSVEVVLTGRDAPAELTALADYVSEIQEIKHPYAQGVQARKGIEY